MSASTFDRVAVLLQDAALTDDSKTKTACLYQVQELIVFKEKSLLDNFYDEVLFFHSDRNAEVRKTVVTFIEEACKGDTELLPRSMVPISLLQEDESINVLKALITCVITLYRLALTWIVKTKGQNKEAFLCFKKLIELKERFLKMLHGPNDGLRMLIMKLMESIILLQSRRHASSEIPKGRMETYLTLDQIPESLHPVLKIRRLEKESEKYIEELCRFVSVAKISSVILHTLINIFCNIARQRPQFMDRAVHGFETIHVNLPPNLGITQVSSLRKSLKSSLLLLLKHPASIDYRSQINTLLVDLGATQAELTKATPKQDVFTRKRGNLEQDHDGSAAIYMNTEKRSRLSDNMESQSVSGITLEDEIDASALLMEADGPSSGDKSHTGSSHSGLKGSSQLPSMTSEVDTLAADLILKLHHETNVTDLVLLSMVALPNNMPPLFSSSYTPIAAAGTEPQIRHLARLLASQLVAAGLSPIALGVAVAKLKDDHVMDDADEDDELDEIQKISNQVRTPNSISTVIGAFRSQQEAANSESKSAGQLLSSLIHQGGASPTTERFSRPGADKAFINENVGPVSAPSSSQLIKGAPVLFARPFSLENLTKEMNREESMNFSRYSYTRLLEAQAGFNNSRTAVLPNSPLGSHLYLARIRLLTLLPSMFGNELYGLLCDFCMKDLKQHFDILVQLVWQEYVRLEGYQTVNRQPLTTAANYDAVLSQLLQRLAMSGVKETYFQRLLLDAPRISASVITVLKWACCHGVATNTAPTAVDDQSCTLPLFASFDVLKELIMTRTQQRDDFLDLLLDLCGHSRPDVASHALIRVREIYRLHQQSSSDEFSQLCTDFQTKIEKNAIEKLNQLQLPRPTAEIFPFGVTALPTEWKEDACRPCLALIIGLLPENPSLLEALTDIYLKVVPAAKRCILRLLDSSVKAMGMDCVEILRLVENCPKGAETLIIRLIHILTEKAVPSPELVEKVKELYSQRISDVRFLIPVLKGLSKNEIIAALPKLIQLTEKVVKEVFSRLMAWFQEGSGSAPITPEELLVALHQLEFISSSSAATTADSKSEKEGVELKCILRACQFCFAERRVFTQERLSIVINQLMDTNPNHPLPTLFMRTVLQSLAMYPRLKGYILNILTQCIKRKIWTNASLWNGFLRCCLKLQPQSFQVMLQLPPDVLESVLVKEPETRKHLSRYISNFSTIQRMQISQQVINVLEKEPELPPVIATPSTNQPVEKENDTVPSLSQNEESNSSAPVEVKFAIPAPVAPLVKKDASQSSIYGATISPKARTVNLSKLAADKERSEEEKRKHRERMQKLMSQNMNKFSFASTSSATATSVSGSANDQLRDDQNSIKSNLDTTDSMDPVSDS